MKSTKVKEVNIMAKHILLGTHGRFGVELIKSAEMILGEMNDIKSFSLLPGMSIEEYMAKIEIELQRLPSGTLCIVDLFGGTPCNTFTALSKKYHNIVVTGLNLPMLLEIYMKKNEISELELAELALKIVGDSGRNTTAILKGENNG